MDRKLGLVAKVAFVFRGKLLLQWRITERENLKLDTPTNRSILVAIREVKESSEKEK